MTIDNVHLADHVCSTSEGSNGAYKYRATWKNPQFKEEKKT